MLVAPQSGRDNMTIMPQKVGKCGNPKSLKTKPPEKETIHSGHFMVSDFEAEAQDDGDELAVPLPEEVESKAVTPPVVAQSRDGTLTSTVAGQQLSIETSLTKLFQCMSLAYRQKLTSPKWNRFKGIRLRWKDKIRLNNVIWRCWHMQFIGKKNTLVCQFASPLDVDTHNKPEAVVLEGKYWKRKLSAVTAEYKKWRMFHRNQILGCYPKDGIDLLSDLEFSDWQIPKPDTVVADEDYMEFMSDTLFSAISSNQPFAFPDPREIARGAGIADFIQPSLVQLQPNLDDFMDTLEPLQDLLQAKLAPVPEETVSSSHDIYKGSSQPFTTLIESGEKPLTNQLPYPYINNCWYATQFTPPSTPDLASASTQFKIPPSSFSSSPSLTQNSKSNSNSGLTDKQQSSARRTEVFAVPKIKPKPRSSSGPCSTLPRKEAVNPSSLVTAVSDSALQPNSSQQSNSALLEQLLTNNVNVVFSCMGAESTASSQTSSQVPARLDTSYESNLYRSIDSSLIFQSQSGITKPQGTTTHFGLSSDSKRTVPLGLSLGSSNASSTIIVSPTSSPIPTLAFVSSSSTGATSPDSPVSDPLSYSPQSIASPSSSCNSPSSGKIPPAYKEHRRVCHINAEQKRRCNIKNGFDTLHSLIPQLNQNPNSKLSKAVMLQKGADYIRQLRNERNQLKQEIDSLHQEIDSLNFSISTCQAMLPATGAPVSKQRSTKMRDMYQQYVQQRTHEDWKFWILSLICEPLLVSFSTNVSTSSLDELYTTTLQWVDQHCSLVDLRPIVLNSLRQLCTTTDVLTDPSKLPMEAKIAVDGKSQKR